MNRERKQVAVRDLLEQQKKPSLLATLESVPDKPDAVKVTRWIAGSGCQCSGAFVLPQSTIESVSLTGQQHLCCGKALEIVEIQFKPDASIPLADILSSAQHKGQHESMTGMLQHAQHATALGFPSPMNASLPVSHGGSSHAPGLHRLLSAALQGSQSHASILAHLLSGGSVAAELLSGSCPPGGCGSCACCCNLYGCWCKSGVNCNNCYLP